MQFLLLEILPSVAQFLFSISIRKTKAGKKMNGKENLNFNLILDLIKK